jgi:hypothetical protein
LFWTNRAHPNNVSADTARGRATFVVSDVILPVTPEIRLTA